MQKTCYYLLYLDAAICASQRDGLLVREVASMFVKVCRTGDGHSVVCGD